MCCVVCVDGCECGQCMLQWPVLLLAFSCKGLSFHETCWLRYILDCHVQFSLHFQKALGPLKNFFLSVRDTACGLWLKIVLVHTRFLNYLICPKAKRRDRRRPVWSPADRDVLTRTIGLRSLKVHGPSVSITHQNMRDGSVTVFTVRQIWS